MKVGDKVRATAKDGSVQDGVVVDVLTVMLFIKFDDGSDNFCYKADRNLKRV